jgi:outer membrane protein OmpA-like peptidoglycan-associated protein
VKIPAVLLAVLVCSGASPYAHAQTAVSNPDQTPQYRENVVSRSTPAMNYGHRSDSTKIDFQGTDLMSNSSGMATVQSKRGATKISAEFQGLQKSSSFGNEYLTYVLWAISPDGRPVNLGEVLVGDNHRSKLDVTTDLQAFALIVTAEPYYAVRRPSNVVVLENVVRADTVGTSEAVVAKYELIDRGGYIPTGYTFDPVVMNAKLPLEFFEARNAVRIAKSAGAEENATSSYDNAVAQMKTADDMATAKHVDRKVLIAESREVVQTADDAREISVKRIEADRIDADKNAAAAEVANATARSEADNAARKNAELAAADSDKAAALAQQEQLSAQAESDRNRQAAVDANQATTEANSAAALAQQQQLSAQAESDRNRQAAIDANQATTEANSAAALAQQQQLSAQAESDRNLAATADANKATADAQQGQRDAEADSARSKAAASISVQQLQQAVQDREDLRARLLQQFNAILVTHDTARGLVVSMPDVLFDSGQYTLRPLAREKLAKISGIVLAYPDLKLAIEGNTDSVGSDAMNQTLSEKRAGSVMDYLTKQNIPAASMTAQGFGKTQPVASNDSAEGRQQNRRVELVVSGDVIGTEVGTVSENLPASNR